MLVDSFGRPHDYLRISLTDHCNFRCTYCMPDDCIQFTPTSALMSKDEIMAISREFIDLGIKKIRLTGGEPLVRKDFNEILKMLSELPVELAITTNGVLVDAFLSVFKKSGLNSINISLDSLKPDKFYNITQRNNFKRVMDNILLSIKSGFKVKINVVVMHGINDNEISDFVELTRKLPVHIRFIEFMPFFGNDWTKKCVVPSGRILETINRYYDSEKLTDHRNSTSKAYRVNNHKGTFGVISTVSEPFCSTCNRLIITADGKLRNCLFSKTETDLLTPLRDAKNIKMLITRSVTEKSFKRGGLQYFNGINNHERSMVKIGG